MAHLRVWLAFLLLSLVWGSSYLFIRVGLRDLSPLALVALRLCIGAAALWLLALALRSHIRLEPRHILVAVVVATTNTALPFLLISWGEETVASGLTSVLNSTVPIFSVLIAGAVLGDEPVTGARLGGVGVGFLGVLLLLSRDLTHGAVRWSTLGGQGAVVLASLFYACSAVLARRYLRGVPAMAIAVWTVTMAAVEVLAVSLVFSRPGGGLFHPSALFAVLWLGVLGSALAYLLYYFILEHWGASRTTLVTYMLPVVGLTLGATFLHETVDWRILAGSVLVIGGVVMASFVRRPRVSPATDRQEMADSPV